MYGHFGVHDSAVLHVVIVLIKYHRVETLKGRFIHNFCFFFLFLDMSFNYCVLSEEPLLCSICLDVFTHPVTIPCGHNFCKKCITRNWDLKGKYECPLCKDMFIRRPVLRVNSVLSEIADQFRQSPLKKPDISSEQQCNKSYVLCDVCTETKLKALKSCMVCKTSYCKTHLGPHCTFPGLKRHKLIDPAEKMPSPPETG